VNLRDEAMIAAPRARVVKAPAERRAELLDCAQRLFLSRGYERTTINDVITATGLSKGAFYHHYRSKEDLLEGIAARFAGDAYAFTEALGVDHADALQRLNGMLSLARDWKLEHITELKPMFTVLLKAENAVLYHRIVEAVFAVLAPALTRIIDDGVAEGTFDPPDARAAADTLLWLTNGRRPLMVAAMADDDHEAALERIVTRVRAEEAIIDRILGLPEGSVQLLGPESTIREMLRAWYAA
jgi:AcrR family transcriptional regulator